MQLNRPLLDGNVKPVPAYLVHVFEGREELCLWRNRLQLLRDELARHESKEHTNRVDFITIRRCLDLAFHVMGEGMPFTACPDCLPDVVQCPRCHGKRWLSQQEYQTPGKDALPSCSEDEFCELGR